MLLSFILKPCFDRIVILRYGASQCADMCQDPRKFLKMPTEDPGSKEIPDPRLSFCPVDPASCPEFLRDPVELRSCLEKLLLDPTDPGSCSEKLYWLRCVFDH